MIKQYVKRIIILLLKAYCSVVFYVFYRGNEIQTNAMLRMISFSIQGKNNSIIFKDGCVLNNTRIELTGTNNEIVFDENVVISEGGRIRVEGNNNKLHIGKNSNLIYAFFSMGDDNNDVIIGEDCLLSSNVVIRNWDNHSIVMADAPDDRICKGKSVNIGNHVWVSNGVTILKGVHIGNDSIIGTMSVVTSDVPANTIVAGNPAKPVKTGVTWCREWLEKCI